MIHQKLGIYTRIKYVRHTFKTKLVKAGVTLYKDGKLLGHRDVRTTQRYSHHSPESLKESVLILNNSEKSTNIAKLPDKLF
jgi:site-specific recombinase XerD